MAAIDSIDVATLSSGAATDGQVPTADGAGGVAWGTPTGGGGAIQSTRVYRSAALSIASGGSGTYISFDAESYDDGGWHDLVTNPSRITVPSNGLYLIQGQMKLGANATGERSVQIHVNGSYRAYIGGPGSTISTAMQVQTTLRLTAGQYVELLAYQTSGSSLALSVGEAECWFAVTRLGD